MDRPKRRPARRSSTSASAQGGFSLMEAMVATVIAVIAILGLAYSFGMGRAFIDRFEVRRVAQGVAQGYVERLGALPVTDPDLAVGQHPAAPVPIMWNGRQLGTLTWRVATPSDVPTAPLNVTSALHEVTVTAAWTQGGMPDSIAFTRLVAAP